MSVLKNRWVKRLGIGTLALLGLGAVTLQPTPANARVFFSVGVPAYGYAPYYPYPAYYSYPYYGYPYSGFAIGFGGGGHHHRHHWHH